MITNIVQDYIDAAAALGQEAFCRQLPAPVLITALPLLDRSFQAAPTRMLAEGEQLTGRSTRVRLDHRSEVLELRPDGHRRAPQISIGRAEENDVVIQDETVSTRHALFLPGPAGGGPALQDLESTNGTRVNDASIIPMRVVRLRDGDVVSFGDATYFFYSPAGLWTALRKLIRG
jgi:hypothetical protein